MAGLRLPQSAERLMGIALAALPLAVAPMLTEVVALEASDAETNSNAPKVTGVAATAKSTEVLAAPVLVDLCARVI